MTSVSRFFQAGFSAALAITLLVQASPARAEPVTLSCQRNQTTLNGVSQPDDAGSTLTLRINYETGLVEELGPSGESYTNRVATATISPNAIVWLIDQYTAPFRGKIDRLSGTGWIEYYHSPVDVYGVSFTCRQATKPKF